ncbi:MAG: hypothetical protein M3312_08455 [Actinomycetota bacterium]|nr:hypothetical protein [Actinomycetota bacterium]
MNRLPERRVFWIVWGLAAVAVLAGYLVDWLNTGAFAGAYALLVALAGTSSAGRASAE